MVARPSDGDEIGGLQDPEVLRDGRSAEVTELRRQLTRRSFVVADETKDAPPGGIGQRVGGGVEMLPGQLRCRSIHVSIFLHVSLERKLIPTKEETVMETLDALAQSFDHTTSVIGGVRADQMSEATPCSEWDVRALLTHTVGVVTNIGNGVRGNEMADPNAIALDNDVAAQFRIAAASTLAAWRSAGIDGEANIGAGPMPASMAVGINLVDTTTHAWDIARATGQPEEIPAELAATVLAVAHTFLNDDIRNFAGIGPAIEPAADATPTEKLVAFLGRRS